MKMRLICVVLFILLCILCYLWVSEAAKTKKGQEKKKVESTKEGKVKKDVEKGNEEIKKTEPEAKPKPAVKSGGTIQKVKIASEPPAKKTKITESQKKGKGGKTGGKKEGTVKTKQAKVNIEVKREQQKEAAVDQSRPKSINVYDDQQKADQHTLHHDDL